MNTLNFFNQYVIPVLYTLPALFVTITIHELAHGYTAYRLGDPTAKRAGRLTLNPLKHIDLLGMFSLLILHFGWAKPVPYNPNYFSDRRRGTFLVAIAGPLSNILIATVSLALLTFINSDLWFSIFQMLFYYNVTFAVFNLLPVPPLDGSKVIISLLPESTGVYFLKYERYGYALLLILIFTDVLDYVLAPAITATINLIVRIVEVFV